MSFDALDYSWSRPDHATMKSSGVRVVARYLWNGGKGLTLTEWRSLEAHGIAVVANYEGYAGAAFSGAGQGRVDGLRAVQLARDIGWPKGRAIYASCDRQITNVTELQAVVNYYRAYGAVLAQAGYVAGAYGQFLLISTLAVTGVAEWGWQTLAWSGGQLSVHACLYQYAIDKDFHGSSVDYNRVISAPNLLAAWPAGLNPEPPVKTAPKPAAPVTTAPPLEDDDMYTIWQVSAHDKGFAGRQYAVRPGYAPFWMTPTIKARFLRFGWFTNPTSPKLCEYIEIQGLAAAVKKVSA